MRNESNELPYFNQIYFLYPKTLLRDGSVPLYLKLDPLSLYTQSIQLI